MPTLISTRTEKNPTEIAWLPSSKTFTLVIILSVHSSPSVLYLTIRINVLSIYMYFSSRVFFELKHIRRIRHKLSTREAAE